MQRQFTLQRNQVLALILCLLLCVNAPVVSAAASSSTKSADLDAAHAAINDMDYSSAVEILNRYLNSHPQDIEAMRLLARTYTWDNQFKAAGEIYSQLLKTSPKDVEYLFGEANALVWQHKNAEAIPLLEQARSLQPDNADILRTLILTLNISNKPEDKQRVKELSKLARQQFPNLNWDVIAE